MRWPIRYQILLPLVFIQVCAVLTVVSLAAWWSLRGVDREIQSRFDELARTIQEARFPLTPAVLHQMQGLSGAEFVIQDEEGNVLAETLNTGADNAILLPESNSHSGAELPTRSLVVIAGTEYRSVRVPTQLQGMPAQVLVLYPNSLVKSAQRDAIQGPVLIGLLTLALTTIAVIFVARHIGQRIHAIERQVAKVAQGNFEPIQLPARQDELRDLSESVNVMSDQLAKMARQIRETERAHLLKQVAGGIAHQLRNSLTGIQLTIQVHRRRCESAADESLAVALRQIALTEEQIRGLVALIRDEQRPRIPGKLFSLMDDVATLIRPMCEHRQINFFASRSGDEMEVIHADQMRAALLNLCINAIEAAPPEGRVELEISTERRAGTGACYAVIEIRDNGPGVPPEYTETIFEPFQTYKHDGIGLGLALVKQTAEDQSGTIQHFQHAGQTVFRLTCAGTAVAAVPDIPAAKT